MFYVLLTRSALILFYLYRLLQAYRSSRALLSTPSSNFLPSFKYVLATTLWAGPRGQALQVRFRWSQRFAAGRCDISTSSQTTCIYFPAISRRNTSFSSRQPRMLPLMPPVIRLTCPAAKRPNEFALAAPQRLGTLVCPTDLERKKL